MSPALFSSSQHFGGFPHVLSLFVWPIFVFSRFWGRILSFNSSLWVNFIYLGRDNWRRGMEGGKDGVTSSSHPSSFLWDYLFAHLFWVCFC